MTLIESSPVCSRLSAWPVPHSPLKGAKIKIFFFLYINSYLTLLFLGLFIWGLWKSVTSCAILVSSLWRRIFYLFFWECHTTSIVFIFLQQIYLHQTPFPSHTTLFHTFFLFLNLSDKFVLSKYSYLCGLPLESGWFSTG